jgi:hypothetical protein
VTHLLEGSVRMSGDTVRFTAQLIQATDGFVRALELDSATPVVLGNSSALLKSLGREAEDAAAQDSLIVSSGSSSPYDIASVFANCGDADRTFEWLDKSVAANDGGTILILVDPLLANVRSDPRWLPLLSRIGKAPQQVGKIMFKVPLPPPAS